jgi:uncharacterized membrane protein
MTTMAPPAAAQTSGAAAPDGTDRVTRGADRLVSIDIVRGAVMVLMAIDHVRVYAGVPAGGPTPGVFFTRWVTHFCAPAFVFLAGTAAFLLGERLTRRSELSGWLLSRGAWLVLLELTVIRVAWTFNFDFANYVLLGVIWVLGWCMILMAALVRLPLGVVAALGIAIIAGHNVIPFVAGDAFQAWWGRILYRGGGFALGGGEEPTVFVLYSIVPWIGVMASGYAFGALLRVGPERRRRVCLTLGGALTLLFVVLRAVDVYGDRPWRAQLENMPAALAFLNTSKYPASLLFLLMTLGPTIFAVGLLESARGPFARWLTVFGRVPFFYYLLHIPTIHLVAILISTVRTPAATGVALPESSARRGPRARRVSLESRTALPRHGAGRDRVVFPMPLVRRGEAAPIGGVVALLLSAALARDATFGAKFGRLVATPQRLVRRHQRFARVTERARRRTFGVGEQYLARRRQLPLRLGVLLTACQDPAQPHLRRGRDHVVGA